MHPIEQLRFVARSRGVDANLLVEDAASALAFFTFEPRALITASRQLLTRQPTAGALWWLCSRMLLAADPQAESLEVVDELRHDQTISALCSLIGPTSRVHCPDSSGLLARRLQQEWELVREISDADVVVVASSAWGGSIPGGREVLVDQRVGVAVANANRLDIPVWLVLSVGTQLPDLYWSEVLDRCQAHSPAPRSMSAASGHRRVGFSSFERLVDSSGWIIETELGPPTMPVAPELLVRLG